MTELREQIEQYIKRVKELAEHVKGNEEATKQSLIGPFFTMLGYDLTDPRECKPEYRVDFGKGRSSKPIDWAFKSNGAFAFFVEAKEVGGRVADYDEQLADYFAKDPDVKLGILTNGAHWRFFTDVVAPNVMDKEPFAKWDVYKDPPPLDVIKLIEKSGFNAENLRTYARKRRDKNLLVSALGALLDEPHPSFIKLAIEQLETRNLTANVIDGWKPIVAAALNEWAAQRRLEEKLSTTDTEDQSADKVEVTPEQLGAFGIVKKMLGADRAIAYETSAHYLKIHLAEKRTWVFLRLFVDRKHPAIQVPLPLEKATELADGHAVAMQGAWAMITLNDASDLRKLGPLFEATYDHVKHARAGDDAEPGHPNKSDK